MPTIAILTPDPTETTYAQMWPELVQRLQSALAGAGIEAVATPWTEHSDEVEGLRAYPLILPLLAWGYYTDHARWLRACHRWDAERLPLANPAPVLAWNSDKHYLQRLGERGIAVPPTRWASGDVQRQVDELFDAGASELIVKPTVSAGAWKTQRLRRGDALEALPVASMIQPYLPSIESAGETSLLFFDGRFSHAINKRPPSGEFRIQVQYGGTYTRLESPPDGALALATQTLAAIAEPLLYARIDTVPGPDGGWLLMEAELIEPDFYLGAAPEAGATFARAVRERLG